MQHRTRLLMALSFAGLFLLSTLIVAASRARGAAARPHEIEADAYAAEAAATQANGGASCCAGEASQCDMEHAGKADQCGMDHRHGTHGKHASSHVLPMKRKVGTFTIILDSTPPLPKMGENRFRIRVQDRRGQSVTDARVRVTLSMPSMKMEESKVAARHAGAGVYSATVNLSMAGEWRAKVSVERPGQRAAATRFDFQAAEESADGKPAAPESHQHGPTEHGHDH
ncbi:MAG: FixH family protein [Armatimonadetes bacterium]|nr:FixH family protein [Armatimonadota bacterium]